MPRTSIRFLEELINTLMIKIIPRPWKSWAGLERKSRSSITISSKSFFPDELAGYKGLKLETNSVFGINNVERAYKGKDGSEIKVSLTGGTGGAGAGAGFGQLAALGGMAAMMQGQNDGSETFRLDGRTANLQLERAGGSELTVFLNSGSILKLEMSNKATSDALKGFASAIKVNDLDGYLGETR